MGDKSELLATVRQSEGSKGPLSLDLVTDVAAPLVLHWGVRKGGRGDWSKPPDKLWPSNTTKATETAVDTPFQVCMLMLVMQSCILRSQQLCSDSKCRLCLFFVQQGKPAWIHLGLHSNKPPHQAQLLACLNASISAR